jgi:hypothetical protein
MRDPSQHAADVDSWIERLPPNAAPEQMVSAFEQGFAALWRRAQRTLGEVTVSAIVDRVLHDVSAQIPLLAALKVENDIGVQFGELRRRLRPEDVEQLRKGMRSTLVQLLTVMGNLTADILTPALHVELSSVRVEDLSPNGDRPPRTTNGLNRESEGRTR